MDIRLFAIVCSLLHGLESVLFEMARGVTFLVHYLAAEKRLKVSEKISSNIDSIVLTEEFSFTR